MMFAFVLLFTVVILGVVEIISRRESFRNLYAHFSLDTNLTEPGEVVTLRYTVRNTGILPVMYGGLSLRLDTDFAPEEDEAFMKKYTVTDFTGTRISYHFFLPPKRQISGRIRFSVRRRGLYDLGRYYLETGDFMGLKPRVTSGELGLRIICTAATCDVPSVNALGGELGTFSVRRFLYDDPTMVLGYRDYTGHEPLKQISWNQSAKAGRLIVRQNDYTADHAAVVVVNIDPTSRRLMERCLSMTSTVCRMLEQQKVPYAMQSNGDLFSLTEGLGTSHLFFIQRRIGLSGLTGYTRFSTAIEACLRMKKPSRTYIVITPSMDESTQAAVRRLARHVDREPVVLCAEENIA